MDTTDQSSGIIDPADVSRMVTEFVVEQLLDGQGDDLDPQTPLLALGVLDSISMTTLLSFIESEFGVHVSNDDVSPENFESIEAISGMITRNL